MKKWIEAISNAGAILFGIAFVLNLVNMSNGFLSGYESIIQIVMWIGFLMLFTRIIYQMIHWNEYKNENIRTITFFAILILMAFVIEWIKSK